MRREKAKPERLKENQDNKLLRKLLCRNQQPKNLLLPPRRRFSPPQRSLPLRRLLRERRLRSQQRSLPKCLLPKEKPLRSKRKRHSQQSNFEGLTPPLSIFTTQ